MNQTFLQEPAKAPAHVFVLDISFSARGERGTSLSKPFATARSAVKYLRLNLLSYLIDLGFGIDSETYRNAVDWLDGKKVDDQFDIGRYNFDMNADDPDYATWTVGRDDNEYWCQWVLHNEEIL